MMTGKKQNFEIKTMFKDRLSSYISVIINAKVHKTVKILK
jgi:hypothetical protein